MLLRLSAGTPLLSESHLGMVENPFAVPHLFDQPLNNSFVTNPDDPIAGGSSKPATTNLPQTKLDPEHQTKDYHKALEQAWCAPPKAWEFKNAFELRQTVKKIESRYGEAIRENIAEALMPLTASCRWIRDYRAKNTDQRPSYLKESIQFAGEMTVISGFLMAGLAVGCGVLLLPPALVGGTVGYGFEDAILNDPYVASLLAAGISAALGFVGFPAHVFGREDGKAVAAFSKFLSRFSAAAAPAAAIYFTDVPRMVTEHWSGFEVGAALGMLSAAFIFGGGLGGLVVGEHLADFWLYERLSCTLSKINQIENKDEKKK